jgi:hypothetical protein
MAGSRAGMFRKRKSTVGTIIYGGYTCQSLYMMTNGCFLRGILVRKFTTCHFWTLGFRNKYTQCLTNSFALALKARSNDIPIDCHLDNIQLLIFQRKHLNLTSWIYRNPVKAINWASLFMQTCKLKITGVLFKLFPLQVLFITLKSVHSRLKNLAVICIWLPT